MPTYAYACTACDEQIEVVQRFTDSPLTDCPSCAGTLRKLFHPVGIVFKGSGFYKTDARSSSGRSSAAGTPAAPAASDSGSAGSGSAGSGSATAPTPAPSTGTDAGTTKAAS